MYVQFSQLPMAAQNLLVPSCKPAAVKKFFVAKAKAEHFNVYRHSGQTNLYALSVVIGNLRFTPSIRFFHTQCRLRFIVAIDQIAASAHFINWFNSHTTRPYQELDVCEELARMFELGDDSI